MKRVWRIHKYDSLEEVGTWNVPGHYTQVEVERILQALVCRDLTEGEIIDAMRRRSDPFKVAFLDRIGKGPVPHYGASNYWYTATFGPA